MIEEIRIKNFGIFSEIYLTFSEGLNVITGETGAGKSMLIGSLQFLLGGRASTSMIKEGEKFCEVEALFKITKKELREWFEERGISLDEDRILIKRILESDGRSRVYIGGSISTVGTLREIGEELVEITGQGGAVELLKPQKHAEYLDAFCESISLHKELKQVVKEIRELKKKYSELNTLEKERERRIETLKFELKEIEEAKLKEGELEELMNRREMMKKGEKLAERVRSAYELLYEGEGSANEKIGTAKRLMQDLTGFEKIDNLIKGLESAESELKEVIRSLEEIIREIRYDPQEIERIEERITLIKKLMRKYGGSEKELIEYAKKISEELKTLESAGEKAKEIEKLLNEKCLRMSEIAEKLSEKRKTGAEKLSKEVSRVLSELGMKGAKFVVHLEPLNDGIEFNGKWFSENGAEKVLFKFSSSPSGEPKPLHEVASGGELSRVLLAIKSITSYKEGIPSSIYDEIDTGVGGAVAEMIGLRLKLSSQTSQVICVTHLPQIAAYGDRHIGVRKELTKKGERVYVEILEGEERIDELARMLSGIEKPESARKLAKELISSAKRWENIKTHTHSQ
jgi:DNA repair protein RecN (Recombination protein N)